GRHLDQRLRLAWRQMRPPAADGGLQTPLEELARGQCSEREHEHLRPTQVDRRDRRNDEEDPSPDRQVRQPDEDTVQPADAVLDQPALEPVVEVDHFVTVTVTVRGAIDSVRRVRSVVRWPPGVGLSWSASPSARPTAKTHTRSAAPPTQRQAIARRRRRARRW